MASVEEKEQEYKDYLNTHRANVKKAYDKIIKPYAEKYLSPNSLKMLEDNIENHDKDKDLDFIFHSYRMNHFPVDEKEKEISKQAYEIAWNYHKKVNPHHWEFFLDDNDENFLDDELFEEEVEIYETAYLEMICDWLSFTFTKAQQQMRDNIGKPEGNISTEGDQIEFDDFYKSNKDKIKIHPQLQAWFNGIVEEIIDNLKKDNSVLYEGIINRKKYHEDNNTFLIRSSNGFLVINPKTLQMHIELDYHKATTCTSRDELTLWLSKLLKKYPEALAGGTKIYSIAELEKDMKDNPNKYNFKQEIEMQQEQQIENAVFNDKHEISNAIYNPNKDEEKEDFSIYEED